MKTVERAVFLSKSLNYSILSRFLSFLTAFMAILCRKGVNGKRIRMDSLWFGFRLFPLTGQIRKDSFSNFPFCPKWALKQSGRIGPAYNVMSIRFLLIR